MPSRRGDEERGSPGTRRKDSLEQSLQTAREGFFEKWDVSQHKTKMKTRSSLGFLFVCGEEVETWVLYQ